MNRPTLPHGSTGPATRVRRTLLPWCVGIQEDHSTLDVLEIGTWEELAAAYRTLTAASSSPSGHTHRYRCIPYRFPPAPPLEKLGPISKALVGRCRWDDIDVVQDLNVLFGTNVDAARQYHRNLEGKRSAPILRDLASNRSKEKGLL